MISALVDDVSHKAFPGPRGILEERLMTITASRNAQLVAFALLTASPAWAQQSAFLRAKGDRIVDGGGREVLLRGMGLGGWMLQEGYMLGIKKDGTQHSIRVRLTDLAGKEDPHPSSPPLRPNHLTPDTS